MAFFDATSNHMLSMIAAVYGVFIYSISFSLEMWFIVTSPLLISSTGTESNVISFDPFAPDSSSSSISSSSSSSTNSAPIFAFILAALYFIIVMVSLILILGIIIRSMMCVSTWLITILITFLPEGGLVIFVTFYAWNIDERNGQIELCFYVIRAILNIFFVICVQNLLSQWKIDKSNASPFSTFGLRSAFTSPSAFISSHGTTTHGGGVGNNMMNSNSSGSPYIDGISSTTINPVFKYLTMRSNSNGNEFDPRGYSFTYDGPNETNTGELSQPYCTLRRYSHWNIDRNDSTHTHADTFNFSTSSISKNRNKNYSTQSLDRRKILIKSSQQPIISTIDSKGKDHEVTLRPLSQAPFDYLQRPGSVLDLTEPTYVPGGGMHSHRQRQYYMSRTLPRDFDHGSSSQSLRDIAL